MNIIKKRLMSFLFEKTPHISLKFKQALFLYQENVQFWGASMLVFFVTKLFLLDYINIQTFFDSSCLEFAKKSRSLVGADSGSTEDTTNISEDLVSVTE